MPHEVTFEVIHNPEHAILDVIFVHGLTGDPVKTWASKAGYWPDWVAEDHPNVRVCTFGYPASKFKKWIKKELDIFELAKLATEFLCGNGVCQRPIIFVTHSLGGVVTKLLLNHCHGSSDEQAAALAARTIRVMFLATPHSATPLPSVVKKELPSWSSTHVAALSGETTLLESIREAYGKYVASNEHLRNVAYYESQKLSGVVQVVPMNCANPGISGTDPIPIEADHISICKPQSKESAIYTSVNRHIEQAKKVAVDTPDLSDLDVQIEAEGYADKADYDRRDLWEKMNAADRENRYTYANSKQNGFARKYMSLGLQPGTRTDYDLLLSEVEQRFQSMVYFPLICKGATEQQIDDAVQEKVIEPLANKQIGGTTFGATKVQSAVYFLTEQCHIRWDSE
ncbi:MAG: ABC-three component system protein [Pseudomonadota bacterium]